MLALCLSASMYVTSEGLVTVISSLCSLIYADLHLQQKREMEIWKKVEGKWYIITIGIRFKVLCFKKQ